MELSKMIVLIVIGLVVLALILFPDFRKQIKTLFGGFLRIFVKDLATTPEGAEAIFEEKIAQAQDSYNRADNALQRASGKLSNAKKDMENYKARLKKVESECDALVRNGKIEEAKIKSEERQDIISAIQRQEQIVKVYSDAEYAAKMAHTETEKNLRKLKRESKEIIENMRVKQITKEVFDDINELKNETATDKLLDHVRDKNKDLDAMAEGARVVHESRMSTKLQKAEDVARKADSDDYLNNLMKKYGK